MEHLTEPAGVCLAQEKDPVAASSITFFFLFFFNLQGDLIIGAWVCHWVK